MTDSGTAPPPHAATLVSDARRVFPGDSEMAARCRACDWAATPLGPIASWSPSLRTAAGLVVAAPVGMILLWGPELVQVYNDAYAAIMGAKHPGGLGQPNRTCWPEVWDFTCPIYEAVLRQGEAFRFEDQPLVLERGTGRGGAAEQTYFTLSYSPVHDEAGTVGGILVSVLETTAQVRGRQSEAERVRLAAALAGDRTALLEEVFRRAPSFLHVLRGPAFEFEFANAAYYQLVGHRDLIGRPAFEAMPEAAAGGFPERLAAVMATGEPFLGRELPVTLARTPGAPPEERLIDLVYLPMPDLDGRGARVLGHGTDVTDHVRARQATEAALAERAVAAEGARRAAEVAVAQLQDQQVELELATQQLQEQQVELEVQAEALQDTNAALELALSDAVRARLEAEAANRAKGEFLATMSHELRTPLNAIGGYAQLMELGIHGVVTSEQLAALDRIQRGQQHLLGLINAVLNYAKLEAGHVEYRTEAVPVCDALEEVAALVTPQARQKGVAVVLGPCAPTLVARADPEKVRQVLLNLLTNAVKFTDRGGTITVDGAGDAEGRVALRVRDTGCGIAADQLARAFQPFVQLDQRLTRTQEGTGLGLAISRDLARGMGGDLTAESKPGIGSTLTLTLSAAESTPA